MTIEQKIVRDNLKYGYKQYFDQTKFNSKTTNFLCLIEMNKLLDHKIIDLAKFDSLHRMLESNHPDDIILAKELIDQFRTKRIESCKKYQEKNMID